jgi:uncharacterized protein DUF3305
VNQTSVPVAVVMEHVKLADRWQSERWEAIGVIPFSPDLSARTLLCDEAGEQTLSPVLALTLHRDECEGYLANLTGAHPKVFVAWRMEDQVATPWLVTVSYNEAARLMDGGEQVDGVPMPAEIAAWMAPFVEQNYRPPPEKIRRKKW